MIHGKRNNNAGFSMLETLVSILILGMLITFSIMFFNRIYSNPKILLRKESLQLADTELTNCINANIKTDTLYNNSRGNLEVKRETTVSDYLVSVNVYVYLSGTGEEIIHLHTAYLDE